MENAVDESVAGAQGEGTLEIELVSDEDGGSVSVSELGSPDDDPPQYPAPMDVALVSCRNLPEPDVDEELLNVALAGAVAGLAVGVVARSGLMAVAGIAALRPEQRVGSLDGGRSMIVLGVE